ncbi:MAG: autotransporter outer membrane beta-barrel domain-containing protein, partial [Alphaproteobacteria bacterium]|nr:autotransporter outer membrane beta-barrel domain-containing protein [Alphaproteobacteria bacterium]
IDEGSPETGWYGAAFTFYTGDVAETGNRVLDRSNSLWYMFTGYTTWRGRGVFLDTQLSVAINNVKGKRFLSLAQPGGTTFLREADNKHAGLVGSFGATMGAQFNYGQYTHVIPQLSLDGMTMREEGYTESGGGTGFNLKTSPTYNNSLRVFLGSEFRQDLNLGDFFLQPSFKLGYRYDFMAKATRIKAQFLDIDPNTSGNQLGTLFTLQGPRPSQGNYVAGANINASTENWTIGLNYDFVRGSHNETEQVGSISLLGRI